MALSSSGVHLTGLPKRNSSPYEGNQQQSLTGYPRFSGLRELRLVDTARYNETVAFLREKRYGSTLLIFLVIVRIFVLVFIVCCMFYVFIVCFFVFVLFFFLL